MKKYIFTISLLLSSLLSINAQSSDSYDSIVSHALSAAKNDSLILSESLFKKALKMEPGNMRNALLFSNLGTVQRRLKKVDEAIESYTLALNITPYSKVTLLDRASLYLEKNMWDKAYIDYCNVLDIDRKNKEALLYRAYIYMHNREYKEARIDYNTLLQEEPRNKTAQLGMALLNQRELKYREALEIYNVMIVDNPDDSSLLKARANLEMDMNTPDLALIDLQAAAKISPNDADIYVACGDAYMMQKKNREAYVAYEQAVKLGIPRGELREKLKAAK